MPLECVNDEFKHYFIVGEEPKIDTAKLTDFIYTEIFKYKKNKISLFGITIFTFWSPSSS